MPMLIMPITLNYTRLIPNSVINLDWIYREREIDTESQISVARYRKWTSFYKQHLLLAPAVEGEGSLTRVRRHQGLYGELKLYILWY